MLFPSFHTSIIPHFWILSRTFFSSCFPFLQGSKNCHDFTFGERFARPVVSVLFFIIEKNVIGSMQEVFFRCSVGNNRDFVKVNACEMFCKPFFFGGGNCFIILRRSTLAQPRDNADSIATLLEIVQPLCKCTHPEPLLSDSVRRGISLL